MAENVGHVVQIAGPAVDVQFPEGKLPPIYQAVRVVSEGFTVPSPINVILEVQQHLGEGRVRCIAMSATDIAMQRTRPSPRCCCTSRITLMGLGTVKPSLTTRTA